MLIVGRVLYLHHAAYKLLDKRAIQAILSAIVASDGRAACLYSARCRSVSRLSQVLLNPAANTSSQCLLGPVDSPLGWLPRQHNMWSPPTRGRRRPRTHFHLAQNGILIGLLQASCAIFANHADPTKSMGFIWLSNDLCAGAALGISAWRAYSGCRSLTGGRSAGFYGSLGASDFWGDGPAPLALSRMSKYP